MSNIGWRFPKLDDGQEQGFNDGGIGIFKGSDLHDHLAREICQNSLDAKQQDNNNPVVVEFQLRTLDKTKFSAIKQLEDIIAKCQVEANQEDDDKLTSFLKEAKKKLDTGTIDTLVVRDFNTTGLLGAKKENQSVWKALVKSSGVTRKSKGSAGSHGIGKSAPFACSAFRTVFYNTLAKDEVRAFQGVARLITHSADGERTQGTGYFYNKQDKQPLFDDEQEALYDIFKRQDNEYGTDVIVLGYKKTDDWEEVIERAIINNFFMALHEGMLVVKIGDLELNKNTLKDRIAHYAKNLDLKIDKDIKMRQTQEFYTTIIEISQENIKSLNGMQLYIKKDNSFSKKIIEMRATGMRVRIRGLNLLTPFAAVFIARDEKTNDLLKKMEPPCHDNWDPDEIEGDEKTRKSAKELKSTIINWVNAIIKEECRGEQTQELDPYGMSEFLPFDDDETGMNEPTPSKEKDNLSEQSCVSQVTRRSLRITSESVDGKKTEGKKDTNEAEVSNTAGGGQGNSKPGEGDEDEESKGDIVIPDAGTKKLNVPDLRFNRVFPMVAHMGIYKTLLEIKDDDKQVYLAFKARHDDGNSEFLKIVKYVYCGATKNANSYSIGPLDLKGRVRHEIIVHMELNEKMTIELVVR
ncbi:MAG: hypothetical protein FWE53_04420 [Firmicutes bacterium]|nr:hypothetical protein [Bacillota bacterium]